MVVKRRMPRRKKGPSCKRPRQGGLRPVVIWVPDVRAPNFADEAHRQSRAVARSRHAAADQAFIAAISESE